MADNLFNIPVWLDYENFNNYPSEENPTTNADFINYASNQNKLVGALTKTLLWQPNTNFVAGKIIISPSMPEGMEAVALTGGVTGTSEPAWVSDTTEYQDSGVKWQLRWKHYSNYIPTQAEAEAGTDNTKPMTPLRTKQAFDTHSADLQIIVKNNQSRIKEFWENVGGKNGNFSPKNLGTIASVSQATEFCGDYGITSGTFADCLLGNEFIIQDGTYNATYQMAWFMGHYNKEDTALTVPHVICFPKAPLFNEQMNETNITTGGYAGSKMHTSVLPSLVTKLQGVLGSHLLKHRRILSNSVDTSLASGASASWKGASNGWAWTDVYACLPSEAEIYGGRVLSSSLYDIGEANQKLPLFNHINPVQYSRWSFWLRGVASSTHFCRCGHDGVATGTGASGSYGVRPLIILG